jgi:K+-sensing histidine kinase KdpD
MSRDRMLPHARRRLAHSGRLFGGAAPRRTAPGAFDQDVFLGVLSHELRTPVTTIYGGAQILANRDLPEGRRRALAADVGQEAERLFRIVEDLVVLLRSERGELKAAHEPVAIGRLVIAAVEHELARNPDLRIRYLGASDAAVDDADETLLVHVVRNLLDNGIRYSSASDPIEVVVDVDGEEVAVRVMDRGAGTAETGDRHDRDAIDPAATQAGLAGGGLGLFVAARLIHAMGGRSWALPRRGGGAEFGFALPLSSAHPRSRARLD